jgi:hypothetical protein
VLAAGASALVVLGRESSWRTWTMTGSDLALQPAGGIGPAYCIVVVSPFPGNVLVRCWMNRGFAVAGQEDYGLASSGSTSCRLPDGISRYLSIPVRPAHWGLLLSSLPSCRRGARRRQEPWADRLWLCCSTPRGFFFPGFNVCGRPSWLCRDG